MVIVKLMGGLGNQMFQYSLGKLMANVAETELLLDLSFLKDDSVKKNFVKRDYDLDIFKGEFSFYNFSAQDRPIFNIAENNNHSMIDGFDMIPKKLHKKYDLYLTGYFQKYAYVEKIADELKKTFIIKEEPNDAVKNLLNEMQSKNSVCLNFRREFGALPESIRKIDHPDANKWHGVYEMPYATEAMNIICEKVQNPHFYVFSDDIDWCIKNFKTNHPFTIVGHKYKGNKFGLYLMLMKSCKHFIIPNSSFAWWAVFLSDFDEKVVVAPKKWFLDSNIDTSGLKPDGWISI